MSQPKSATQSTKTEPTEKQCTCPEGSAGTAKASAPKTKQRKPTAAAVDQEGFLIRLVPTPGHDLSALRRPPAPRRTTPRPKAPQPQPTAMLLAVGQQPAVALVPALPGAATTPYFTAPSPYLPLAPGCPPFAVSAVANAGPGSSGCGGCHTGCSHGHCCAARGDYSSSPNTLTIPPYAMPFFGEVYRNAAASHAPPAGGGNINVVTKVTSDDRKRKGRGKKRRDSSSEDSTDSYRRKRRRMSGPPTRRDEPQTFAMPVSPPVAPYKPPPPLEEAAPVAHDKPYSPPLVSPPPEENMPVGAASPGGGMYPQGGEAQGAYDNVPGEENPEEEEEEKESSSNKWACIVVIVVVGVCIIIAIVLALYPHLLFSESSALHEQGPLGRVGSALNLLKNRSSDRAVGEHTTAQSSEKQATTWDAEPGKLVGKMWRRT